MQPGSVRSTEACGNAGRESSGPFSYGACDKNGAEASRTSELSLEIVEGPGTGVIVPLAGPLELGRGPDAGLTLDDEHVSDRHARVTPDGDGALVEDLGDPGGTFVNDAEVQTTRIVPGDQIQLGVTVLELRTAADIAARPSAARPKPPLLASAPRVPDYVLPEPEPQAPAMRELQSLLDINTKAKARTASLAIFVLVVFAVLIFLATAKF